MQHSLDLEACFREAWRGFKGWWIPLCLVAAIIAVLSQSWLVRHMLHDELRALQPCIEIVQRWSGALAGQRVSADQAVIGMLDELSIAMEQPALRAAWRGLLVATAWYLGGVFLIICALHVILVVVSKASVQTRREDVTLRRDLTRTAVLTLSYGVLAVMKIMPIMCCCVLPGLYIYLRLYLTDFIITERSPNPFRAAAASWRMTRGNLLRLAVLFIITLATHVLSALTLGLAEIPGRPFEYTLRAAAYRQLRGVPPDAPA